MTFDAKRAMELAEQCEQDDKRILVGDEDAVTGAEYRACRNLADVAKQLRAAVSEVERLKRTERYLRYFETPQDSVTERAERLCKRAEDQDWESLAEDVAMDVQQLQRQLGESLAEREQLRALVVEATTLGRELSAIALDLVNGRAPSISTSEMVRGRMDRLSTLRQKANL